MQLIQRKRESGASLVVGLVLLLIATLVVFAGVRGTQMQERMTSNLNNKAISLKAAEAGASDFLAWIQEELDDGGWPNQAAFDDSDLPSESPGTIVSAANNGVSGQYWFPVNNNEMFWDPDGAFVTFVSVGSAEGLAESLVRVRINAPGGNPPGWIDPPAAVSCLGENDCTIAAGQGQSVIDGHAYDLPPEFCDGRDSCFNDVDPAFPRFRVPGVYIEKPRSGDPSPGMISDARGATSDCKYTGLPTGAGAETEWTDPSDGCNNSIFVGDLRDPPDGKPDHEEYFRAPEGDDEGGIFHITDGESELGKRADNPPKITYKDEPFREAGGGNYAGILVVDGIKSLDNPAEEVVAEFPDGVDATFRGTTVFEGIIVLRNCAKLNMGGTSFVYGAIIVDTVTDTGETCGPDYDPFMGNGTPNVRYSFDGLDTASRALGGGTELRVVSWIDSVHVP